MNRAVRYPWLGVDLGRIIALMRDADQLIQPSQDADDLGGSRQEGNDAHGKLQASSRSPFYPCACPGVGTDGYSRKTGNNRSATAKPPNSTVLYTASPN